MHRLTGFYRLTISSLLLLMGLVLTMVFNHSNAEGGPKLGELQTFEVAQFLAPYNTRVQQIDPEYIDNTTVALSESKILASSSPADGVINISCEGIDCNIIHATVTAGKKGPIVWHRQYKANHILVTWWLHNTPRYTQRVAQQIIRELGQDYLRATHQQASLPRIDAPLNTSD